MWPWPRPIRSVGIPDAVVSLMNFPPKKNRTRSGVGHHTLRLNFTINDALFLLCDIKLAIYSCQLKFIYLRSATPDRVSVDKKYDLFIQDINYLVIESIHPLWRSWAALTDSIFKIHRIKLRNSYSSVDYKTNHKYWYFFLIWLFAPDCSET